MLSGHARVKVTLQVNARYETAPPSAPGIEGVATEVAGAVQKTTAGLESSGVSEAINAATLTGALASGEDQGVPTAYLNYLLYDADYKLVDQGYVQVSEAAAVGKKNPEAAPEVLALDVDVKENGYLYAYLSHEATGGAAAGSPAASSSMAGSNGIPANGPITNNGTPVHFDDFVVEHEGISIVQQDDYYAFGAPFRQQPSVGLKNKYLYQGKEWQSELNLALYDFHARQYDPLLGRFTSLDPADQFASGYVGMGNNPVSMVDPDGEFAGLAAAMLGGFMVGAVQAHENGGKWWVGGLQGAIQSGLTAGLGAFGPSAGPLGAVYNAGVSTIAGNAMSGNGLFESFGTSALQSLPGAFFAQGVTDIDGAVTYSRERATKNSYSAFDDAIWMPGHTIEAARAGWFARGWGDANLAMKLYGNPVANAVAGGGNAHNWLANLFSNPNTELRWAKTGDKYTPYTHVIDRQSYVGGTAPTPGVGRIGSVARQAQSVAQKLGKNSVTIKTLTGHTRYDLMGRAHGPIPTPHKLNYVQNFKPDGTLGNISKASKLPTPMTHQDVRIVRRFLKK